MLTRAQCLDDVVCQAAVAFNVADILAACHDVPEINHYIDQLRTALASMATVLIRDHGEVYTERVGHAFCKLDLLLGDSSKGDGSVRSVLEAIAARSVSAQAT